MPKWQQVSGNSWQKVWSYSAALPQLVDTLVLICSNVPRVGEYSNVVLYVVIRKSNNLIHFNSVDLNNVIPKSNNLYVLEVKCEAEDVMELAEKRNRII